MHAADQLSAGHWVQLLLLSNVNQHVWASGGGGGGNSGVEWGMGGGGGVCAAKSRMGGGGGNQVIYHVCHRVTESTT